MDESKIRAEIGNCIVSLGFLLISDLKISTKKIFLTDKEYVENTIRCCQYNLENILNLTKNSKK